MTDLLETVIEAHGGLDRWNQFSTVTAHLAQGGAFWALKGQPGVLDDVFVTASLYDERVSHHPFGAPGRRSAFTPGRVAIETDGGTVLEALDQPRASFAGHTVETPRTTLQLAYFVSEAMWTYLTQPFTFTLPGFETTELDPWKAAPAAGTRRRPSRPPCTSTEISGPSRGQPDRLGWESVTGDIHRQRITMTPFGDGSSLESDSGFDRVRITGPGGDV